MKQLIALSIGIALLAFAPASPAQSSPPPLPALTAEQSTELARRVDAYRRDTDARVTRGEITADEAARLVQWREWQLAQQAAGLVPGPSTVIGERAPVYYDAPPQTYYEPRPSDYYVVPPAPVYVPYYRYATPYYWGPRPTLLGPVGVRRRLRPPFRRSDMLLKR